MPTEVIPVVHPENETKLHPNYQVVLWDSPHHTFQYVIEMLGKLFGHPAVKAQQMAAEVDSTGRCSVFVGTLEKAEFKRDQIHAYGADPRLSYSKGSMSATVEPLEG
jgi:ATP-dependent Clp protease adaptor protein ClpS